MSLQCKGITKNGEQCKISGTFKNGYCHLHQNQSVKAEIINSTEQPESSSADNQKIPSERDQHISSDQEISDTNTNSNILPILLFALFTFLFLFGLFGRLSKSKNVSFKSNYS